MLIFIIYIKNNNNYYYIHNYPNPGVDEIPEREVTDRVRRKVLTL